MDSVEAVEVITFSHGAPALDKEASSSDAISSCSSDKGADEDSDGVADDWEDSADAMAAAEAVLCPPATQPVEPQTGDLQNSNTTTWTMPAAPVPAGISAEEKAAVEQYLRDHGLTHHQYKKSLACGAFGRADLVTVECPGGAQVQAVLKCLLRRDDGMPLAAALRSEVQALAAGAGCPNIDRAKDARLYGRLKAATQGKTVDDELVQPLMSYDLLHDFIRDALTGLNQLHMNGFCHGDIKPCNIFRVPDPHARSVWRWVLGDLGGAAQAVGEHGRAVGGAGQAVPEDSLVPGVGGSQGWCSLEVRSALLGGTPAYPLTLKSDMASLGLVIADILGMRYTCEHQAFLQGSAQLPAHAPPGLARLVRQMVAVVPADRPSPAAALQDPWLQA
ncbi:hypothetical protein HXX76_012932 [Chlamydomonas incerta]|uniref:Protein kinase domain-containing protein n=1 Tax=Chlamydomonas incerta TaxID=51695 RepID=A0A835SKE8_CHLIN|nr:hypothetical protein HXX76_012932 [Chlamydomonas incerta]|eukprot:KAG2426617.1 hypothetical protein HXX76_012932 [Chlamydomonas incerta]